MKRYPREKSEKILDLRASLIDAIHTSDAMSDGKMDKKALRWQKIEQFLQTHAYIMNANVRELCGVSAATANRILAGLVEEGKLYKARANGHWAYQLHPGTPKVASEV